MKKLFLVFFVFVIGFSLPIFAAGEQEEEKKELEIWLRKSFTPTSDRLMDERILEFAEMKGIDVKIEYLSVNEQYTKMNAAIESNNHPDIAFFPYNGIAEYYDMGVLRDVSELLEEIQNSYGKMNPNVVKSVAQEGGLYGVPIAVLAQMLFCREDLFNKAGISSIPDTWEELAEAAIAITNQEEGVYGLALGTGNNCSDFEWIMRCIIYAYGGSLFGEDDSTVKVNSPEVKEAFKYVVDLFEKYKVVPPSATNWDDGADNTSYISGQSAMIINPPSVYYTLKEQGSPLFEKTIPAMLPEGPNGRFITGVVRTLAIMTGTEEPELCEELLKYILDPEWYDEWLDITMPLYVPVYEEIANSDKWQTEENAPFSDSVKAFTFIGYPGNTTQKVSIPFNSRYLNSAFQRIIIDGMSIDKSVEMLEKELNEL